MIKVKLLIRQKEGEVGEIVEVSPDRADFFFSVGAAVPVVEAREQAEKPGPKAAKKTPKAAAKKK